MKVPVRFRVSLIRQFVFFVSSFLCFGGGRGGGEVGKREREGGKRELYGGEGEGGEGRERIR